MKKFFVLIAFLSVLGTQVFAGFEENMDQTLVPSSEYSKNQEQLEMDADAAVALDAANGWSRYTETNFECFAKNMRGRRFEGVSRYAERAQKVALNRCYSAGSRRCYRQGCRKIVVRNGR